MLIEQHPIANSSPRYGFKPQLIVVHWTAGFHLQDAYNAFKSRSTSAHDIIDGDVIWNCVPDTRAAWHAGVWMTNLKSIGIEHVGIYEQPVKDETYATSGARIAYYCRKWNFEPTDKTIIPHRQIKATSCPGTLDMGRLIGEARKAYYTPTEPLPLIVPPPPVPTMPHLSPLPPLPTFPKQVRVSAGQGFDGVNLRSAATATAPKVGSLANGVIVTASQESNGFYLVGHNQYGIATAFQDV